MPVSEDLLAEAFLAYLKEAEAGLAPDRQEFLNRHPNLALEMAPFFSAEQEVDTLFSPMRGIFGLNADAPPASFGDYEELVLIAEGGMGVVYRARQKSLNRIVALKVIKNPQLADATDRQRFRLEAKLVANLNHPHIVPVYEVGEQGNLPYFSMKLIEGGSLSQHLAEWCVPEIDPRTRKDATGKVRSRSELRDRQGSIALLVETAALAVHHAHQRGLLHRDLKPGNILLDEAGGPHVTDFGLAKRLQADNQAQEIQDIAGTASYMAPEQTIAKTELTVRVDVYGLGAILYELLTGRAPFRGANRMETLTQVRQQDPEPPSRVRPYVARDLESICLKCLHRDPHRRYASAEELAADLNRFRAGQPIRGRDTPSRERAWMWMKRKPLVASLYGALSVVILLAFGTGILQWRETAEALRVARGNLYAHQVIQAERDLSAGMVDRAERLLKKCPPELCDWEWNYLNRWCRGDGTVMVGTGSPISGLAIHPGGKTIYSGDKDGAIYDWTDRPKHRPLFHQYTNSVSSMSIGGAVLAVAYKDMTVMTWRLDVKGAEPKPWTLPAKGNLVAVSPNGNMVAVSELNNVVRVWDWTPGSSALEPFELPHEAPVICLAFSPDEKLLITGGYGKGKIIKVWDLVTKKERKDIAFRNLDFPVHCVAISPDGHWVALSDGTSIGLWNLRQSNNETRLHGGYKGRFVSIAFSPDSRSLAAATATGSITIWETTGKTTFSARRHTDIIPFVAFTPKTDGPSLLYVRGRELILERWKAPAGRPVRTLGEPAPENLARPVAFDVANARAAIGAESCVLVSSLRDQQNLATLKAASQPLVKMAFSGDGNRLAGVSDKGMVFFWDVAEGATPTDLPAGQESPSCIALNRDGKLVALAWDDLTLKAWNVKVWDVQKRQEVLAVTLGEPIKSIAFSPDGRRLAAGAESGLLKVWDLQSGHEIAQLKGHTTMILSVAFSPQESGRCLASGSWDGTVKLWDVDAPSKPPATFEGQSSAIASVHVSPNGKRIAAAGMDGVVRLWDAVSGQQVLTLQDQEAGVTGVAFCGDNGSLLASVSRRGVIKIWDGSR